jgi:hypothetical protein
VVRTWKDGEGFPCFKARVRCVGGGTPSLGETKHARFVWSFFFLFLRVNGTVSYFGSD